MDAWRFWTITHPRIYTEESEVCNALHASTWCGLRATLARATFTIKPVIMLACHWSIMQGRDMYHICDHWKPSLEYIATLTVGV